MASAGPVLAPSQRTVNRYPSVLAEQGVALGIFPDDNPAAPRYNVAWPGSAEPLALKALVLTFTAVFVPCSWEKAATGRRTLIL